MGGLSAPVVSGLGSLASGVGNFAMTHPMITGSLVGGGLQAARGGDFGDIAKGAAIGAGAGSLGHLTGLSGSGNSLSSILGGTGSLTSPVRALGGQAIGTYPAQAAGGISGGGLGSIGSMFTPSTLARGGASLYSALQGNQDMDELQNILLQQQQASQAALNPYLQTGGNANTMLDSALTSGELGGEFTPGDLTQDPGYQFNLDQGMNAINRQSAATGGLYSGNALKAAQEFGQGLADNTYNDAYNRWLRQQGSTYGMLAGTAGQGQNAAYGMGNINTNMGNIQAGTTTANINNRNKSLSSLLSLYDEEDMF
jgi:hypothetical protein